MRSSTIILGISLLAAPLALLTSSDNTASAAGFPLLADLQTQDTVNGHMLTDAPVPSEPSPGVAPVDRVAGPGSHALASGPINGTPFSSTPSGTLSSGGSQISNGDRVASASDGVGVTPNLGR